MFSFSSLRLVFLLLTLTTPLFLFACSSGPASSAPSTVSAKLVKATDQGELERRFKAELKRRYERRDTWYTYWYKATGIPSPPAGTAGSGATSPTVASSDASIAEHSETNVQEKGVDEGDLVKTDGAFIYLARGSRFLVLKAQPPEQAAIVSDLDLKEQITELYLAEGRVTVVTASSTAVAVDVPAIMGPVSQDRPFTRLRFYDVANPAAPLLTARYDLPGQLRGSRRIGSTLYLVTNHGVDLPSPVSFRDYLTPGTFDTQAFGEACAKATAENLKRIEALTLADLVPTYSRNLYTDGAAGSPVVTSAVDWSDVYVPESGNGTDLSLVFALDTAPAAPAVTSSGVLSSWCRVYMSPEALYLASGNDWMWIEPVTGADAPPANPEPGTALHKFAVAGGGQPLYRGSGVVDGWLNDQFSMGEYKGYLRIGTTRGGWAGEGISNRLAVLAEQEGKLVESGKIEGLAPGELIYSMCFDRDRGYMVTFRQTDPLFTFDLSDPHNPTKAGEIKVNGFATYIHPIGENNSRLLTIGRSADANGRVIGNKLQLFDVTDLAAPRLLGDYELGSGWSAAQYDYHAFLYYPPMSLLAIPYYGLGATSTLSGSTASSSGLRLFTVDAAGIALKGEIPAAAVTTGYGSYNDMVDRSLVIGSDIYAIAQRTMTVAGNELLDIKGVVALPEGYSYYYGNPVSAGVTTTASN